MHRKMTRGDIHMDRKAQRDTQRCTPMCVSYMSRDRSTQRHITHGETYLRHIYGKGPVHILERGRERERLTHLRSKEDISGQSHAQV